MKKLQASQHHTRDRGLYITLVAVFGLALLGFTALVIQLGMVVVAQNRLQMVANLAALSAIEQYIRYVPPSNESQTPEIGRRALTESRANSVLQSNSVWGLDSSKFNVVQSTDSPSRIIFGNWYRFDPDGTGGVSCERYPCFVPSPDATRQGNAVRIIVRNDSSNPFTRFIGQVFGSNSFTIRAEATATLVKRCMAFLVDLSLSSIADTHALPPRGTTPEWREASAADPLRDSVGFYGDAEETVTVLDDAGNPIGTTPSPIPYPTNMGLFAYVDPPPACGYSNLLPAVGGVNYSALYWCSLPTDRETLTSPPLSAFGDTVHFRSDYRKVESAFNQNEIYFDLTTRPEPFSTFLLAFNAALRAVYAESSNADEAMFAGFSKQIGYMGVNRRYPFSGLTTNIPLLVHLTNIENIGVASEGGGITGANPPSFIDLGIFPVYAPSDQATATNIPGAVEDAITALDASCGPSDQKAIVLATDGFSNCYGVNSTVCKGDMLGYISSEFKLLNMINGTARKLIDRQVALTILHSGAGARPNFRKIPTTCPNGSEDCLLDFDGALRSGRSSGIKVDSTDALYCESSSSPGSMNFLNCASKPSAESAECVSPPGAGSWVTGCEADAFRNLGQPGVYFGRAAGVMAELAVRSGGRYCPILPILGENSTANENYLDHDDDPRTPRTLRASAPAIASQDTLVYSPVLRTPGEQASDCAVAAVGGNPFTLVEEHRGD